MLSPAHSPQYFPVSNEQLRKILIEPNFHATTGEITQVFPGGRNTCRDEEGNFTGKLPTGCFETSARFDAEMSGGPVFDENFVVCGVIATGFDFGDEPVNSSFASGTPYIFLLGLPDGDRIMRVYEMVQRDLVESDPHFERMTFSEQDGVINLSFACERTE